MMSLWVLLALRLIFSYLMSHFGFLFQVSLLWISTWRCGEVPVTYCALELSLSCMEWFWWSLLMISLDSEFSPVLLSWIFTWCGKVLVTLGTLQWFLFFMDPLMVLYLDPEKLLPHFMQLNGFSPVWFPSWIFTWCGKAPITFGTLQWFCLFMDSSSNSPSSHLILRRSCHTLFNWIVSLLYDSLHES